MPPAATAVCPDFLSPVAAAEWERMSAVLLDTGVLTSMDERSLAIYCVAFEQWRTASEGLVKTGLVVKSPNGFPVQSPFLSIVNKAAAVMAAQLDSFGCTPSSRTRVTARKKTEANPFDEFRSG